MDAALRALPSWTRRDSALHARFDFADFRQAFAFLTAVAAEAERQQHHPDWRNVWSKVEIKLSTHDAGGITERDLRLARAIQALAGTAR
ncbi:MAG: 4a-hydroxytetrahydrobiopterin dehydratase [Planctomycetes bacterium]|nr:4a-hydroxytetrahydrobiopterin dehydratase [Planctomycetota bacterium]